MSALSIRRTARGTALLTLGLLCFSAGFVSTAAAQDKGAPPWGEFLRRFEKDRLLKLPYHMAEETTPKGLASKIRARELDVPNRIKAIEYLASLDCHQFPEAKAMLITALQNDQWERVRLAAARGLEEMLERNACGSGDDENCRECEDGRKSRYAKGNVFARAKSYCLGAYETVRRGGTNGGKHKGKDGPSKREERLAQKAEDCRCQNCCDEETLNTLSEIAYGRDDEGCPIEPSKRVRDAVIEAINVCGIECRYQPYYVPTVAPVQGDGDDGDGSLNLEGEVPETPPMEPSDSEPETLDIDPGAEPANDVSLPPLPKVTEKADGEFQPVPAKADAVEETAEVAKVTPPAPMPLETPVEPTPIDPLNKICIVSWRDGVRVTPSTEITSVHKGRIYHFADEACKQRFDANPEGYAVAFGGCDPVEFVKTRKPVVGRYLVDRDGCFYMFATMENLDEFNANPESYTFGSKPIIQASANE